MIGIIPARLSSTRLPGKLLLDLKGKSVLQRTYEQAASALNEVLVVTDSQEIADHVTDFGGQALLTSPNCRNGTERIIEALNAGAGEGHEIIVNVQGDEPLIEPEVIRATLEALEKSEAPIATPLKLLTPVEALNPSAVKCVVGTRGQALYFSRQHLPGAFHHIGLYAYRLPFLLQLANLPPTPLQLAEDLEQLKVLEHGFSVQTVVVKSSSVGIDTVEDLAKVEAILS